MGKQLYKSMENQQMTNKNNKKAGTVITISDQTEFNLNKLETRLILLIGQETNRPRSINSNHTQCWVSRICNTFAHKPREIWMEA